MKTINVALIGFGNVGQSFARILLKKREEIEADYDARINVVAITTKTRGNLVDAWGIDLERVLSNIQETGVFPKTQEAMLQRNSLDVAETVDYDVLIEMTPLEFSTGFSATQHVKAALNRGKHVICANKGPIAWHYKELTDLAKKNNCKFLFETTVMDGTPVFNIVRECMKMCNVTEIKGILNSTTNYILQGLEQGKDVKDILIESRRRGFTEANSKNDIEGNEAAAKMVAMANVVMGADITPADVDFTGIEDITQETVKEAAERGNVIKLICRAYHKDGKVCVKISPEEISRMNVYATVTGTSLAVTLTTDLMGTLTLIEESPEVEQAGYGVFSDLVSLVEFENEEQ